MENNEHERVLAGRQGTTSQDPIDLREVRDFLPGRFFMTPVLLIRSNGKRRMVKEPTRSATSYRTSGK